MSAKFNNMITERKKVILSAIIKEYIKTADPVGSQELMEKWGFKISSATIRHEMMGLEEEGYLYQPYTSAGRAPTEKGYQFYIQNFLEEKKLAKKNTRLLSETINRSHDGEEIMLKNLARVLAEISDEAVFVSFSPQNVYCTGLHNILRQPEFGERDLVCKMLEIVDNLEEFTQDIFDGFDGEIKILVGKENPFGSDYSTILSRYELEAPRVVGILGPLRMSYEDNLALLKETQEQINRYLVSDN